MQSFSYTLSPLLKTDIEKIELHRQQLLLILYPPQEEMAFRWETLIRRIQISLRFTNKQRNLRDIERILEGYGSKMFSPEEMAIIHLRDAYFYISQEWSISSETIVPSTLKTIEIILFGERSKLSDADLQSALSFIQLSTEHPVVQAGTLFILTLNIVGLTPEGFRFASLNALLVLTKYGYDFKNYITVEEIVYNNLVKFHQLIQQSFATATLSEFLDFFVFSFEVATRNIVSTMAERKRPKAHPALDITKRQKEILIYMEKPGLKVTNRDVQKLFNISQITASRDLSGLVTIGMLSPHGKGRSVYYTRV